MKPPAHLLCAVLGAMSLFAQEPPPPAPPDAPAGNAQGESTSTTKAPTDRKGRPIPIFLIIGTVFDEKALAMPGVQVRIRRKDEKKYLETYTNSRGEFAVRVVPGYEYEVITHARKYREQSQTVDTKEDVQQRLSIKLQPVEQAKAGEKP